MNKIESCRITDPQNENGTCAKLTIDSTESPFVLTKIMTTGSKYTLSFWVRSEAAGKVRVAGSEYVTSTEWQKHITVFTSNEPDLAFDFLVAGTYYIFHPKLERGNIATDWTIAPEDTIQTVDVEYYLSTSVTDLVGGVWTTVAPEWAEGKYMWTRTVQVNCAGIISYSPSEKGTCIAGASGKGVHSIVEEYYQSTSSSELAGGNWTTSYPGWVNGMYVWTRTTVTYTDNSSVVTDPVCVTGAHGKDGANGKDGVNGKDGKDGEKGDTGVGVASITRYYKLASTEPAKPTTSTPNSEWSVIEPTYVSGSTDNLYFVDIVCYDDGSFNVSEVSLSSSYTTAKEAWDKAHEAVTRVTNAETSIEQNKNEISLRATKTEVTTLKGNMDDSISEINDKFGNYVADSEYTQFKKETTSKFEQTSEDMNIKFNNVWSQLGSNNTSLDNRFKEFEKWIRFSGDNAITIGSSDSAITLEIDNTKGISFKKNGATFGYWDGEYFNTGNIYVRTDEQARFGNFAFVPREDGSLSFLKVNE